MSFLETLRLKVRERIAATREGVVEAARRVAAGENVTAATVDQLLADTGVTVETFAGFVEIATRRAADRTTLAKRAEAAAALARAEGETTKAEAAFAAELSRHREHMAQLAAKADAARRAIERADDARARLLTDVPGAAGEELAVARQAVDEAEAMVSQLQSQARHWAETESSRLQLAAHVSGKSTKTIPGSEVPQLSRTGIDHGRLAKQARTHLAAVQRQLQEARDARDVAAKRLSAAESAALKS
jgi:hypothetical protein